MHVCSYGLTYAIVPQELLDVYPLSQTETALTPTPTAINAALKRISEYLKAANYTRCLIFVGDAWQGVLAQRIRKRFRGRMRIKIIEAEKLDNQSFSKALKTLK